MKTQRFTLPAAAYLILIKEDQLLLLERKGGWSAGMFSLVAGHIDGNETMKEAIVREAYEEVGIIIDQNDLEIKCVMHRMSEDTEYFDIFIQATQWEGNPTNREPEKIGVLKFFSIHHLPDNLLDHVKCALNAIDHGQMYIDYGWTD
jgi:8-oxo-dGTP pyrophosphatase MutT (NUDIX family)